MMSAIEGASLDVKLSMGTCVSSPETRAAQRGARLARLHSEMARLVERVPSVVDVTSADAIPGSGPPARIKTEDATGDGTVEHEVRVTRVAEDFFHAFDAAVLTGRVPAPADRDAVLVNRTFAQRVFGSTNAVGHPFRYVRSEDDTMSSGSLLGGKGAILLPAISLMMAISAGLAVVGPARRALRIQPIDALRED
jgi:hypothetical protein